VPAAPVEKTTANKGVWCLTPPSTIFQLYHRDQYNIWGRRSASSGDGDFEAAESRKVCILRHILFVFT